MLKSLALKSTGNVTKSDIKMAGANLKVDPEDFAPERWDKTTPKIVPLTDVNRRYFGNDRRLSAVNRGSRS